MNANVVESVVTKESPLKRVSGHAQEPKTMIER
jgi:hypothetical protein